MIECVIAFFVIMLYYLLLNGIMFRNLVFADGNADAMIHILQF